MEVDASEVRRWAEHVAAHMGSWWPRSGSSSPRSRTGSPACASPQWRSSSGSTRPSAPGTGSRPSRPPEGPVAAQAELAARQLPGVPVWAIEAGGLIVRPGPRLVDGVEALASILHPGQVPAAPDGRVCRIA